MLNSNGLTNKEVNESRNKYGSNSIDGKNKSTFISLFIETLGDPIIKILLIALFIKVIFLFKDFDYFETIGIVVAILVASLISAVSEYGSNKAFQRMQEESSKINIKVKRNGNITEIPIDDIVVGDIVLLGSGDKVPADITIISGKLSVDESSLNGEAKEVYKEKVNDINKPMDINKIYRGTTIYDGAASGVVTKVGMDTLYGKMAKSLVEKEEDSPLKIRLTNLAKIISRIGYVAATMIAISYLFSKKGVSYKNGISDISNYDGDTMKKAADILTELKCPFIINQNSYNIFNRTIEQNGLKQAARKAGKGIICFSPLAQGMLTDRYLHGIPDDSRIKTDGRFLKQSQLTEERMKAVRGLSELAKQRGESLAQMALKWVLKDGDVTSVLIGASKPEQILENLKVLDSTPFSAEQLKKIDEFSV